MHEDKVVDSEDKLIQVIDADEYSDEALDYKKLREDALDTMRKSLSLVQGSDFDESWASEINAFMDSQILKALFFSDDWVFIIIDLIANKISSQHFRVMQEQIDDEGVASVSPDDEHPLNATIEQPNPFQDYHSWMYNSIVELFTGGNMVTWWAKRNGWLMTLPNDMTTLHFDNNNQLQAYLMTASRSEHPTVSETTSTFPKDEVVHVKRPNPGSLHWGLSPLIPGRKSILFNRYTQDYLNQFYVRQATPGLALVMDKVVNEKVALRQLKSFELAYQGRKNARRTMIIPKGVKVETLSHSIADQQITQLVKNNRETIINLLKVPKHELGLQESGSLGSEEHKIALRNFWESTLIPTMRTIEGTFNNFFERELGPGRFFQFDLSEVEALRDDLLKKAGIAKEGLAGGLSVNEVRAKVWEEERIEDPNADKPFVLVEKASAPQQTLALPVASHEEVMQRQSKDVEPDVSPMSGIQVSNVLDVLKELKDEKISRDQAIMLLQTCFSMPAQSAEKLVGDPIEVKTDDVVIPMAEEIIPAFELSATQKDLVGRMQKQLDQEFEGKQNELIDVILRTLTQVAEVAIREVRSELQKSYSIYQSKAQINQAQLRRRLLDAIEAFESGTIKAFYLEEYLRVLESAVELGYDQQLAFVFNHPAVDEIEALRARGKDGRSLLLRARGIDSFSQITRTHTDRIVKEIAQGVQRNETIDQLTIRVAETFADRDSVLPKARTIARTEALTAVSVGHNALVEDAAKEIKGLRKMWITAGDSDVRTSHKAAQLEGPIAQSKTFKSTGLKYPRQPGGDADEVINCRCTLIVIPPGVDADDLGEPLEEGGGRDA